MYSGGEKFKMRNTSDQQGENERQWRKKRTGTQETKSFFSTYDIFVSTYDISSIIRVITRKFVKFDVEVVQQQRQRNVQKKRDARAKFFFYKLDLLIFDKHSGSYELYFLLFKRDNILHAWHFSARMAHFPCMFLIDLILSTYLKDFFSIVLSLFFC